MRGLFERGRSGMNERFTTEELVAWDRAHVWHPFTPMKPWVEQKDFLVIERGEREFLFDTEGRKYIDGTSSLWCNVHGHGVSEIDAAVVAQLGKVAHSTLLGMANVPSILLAKKLVELAAGVGMDLPRVFYSDNGSTAVEVACKMAFQKWRGEGKEGRGEGTRFVAFENSYHGDTLGAVSVGGIETFHGVFKPLCFTTDFVPVGESAAENIERLLTRRPGAHVAVVIEPVIQGAGGMILHPAGTLRRVREVCDRHGVMLIADEVLTGFGRTGTMFACEREAVTPDFLCLSKGLTGGYMPLGATLTTQKVFDAFYADPREGKTFFHGHTYTGHPLACAAALASIELIASSNLLAHVRRLEPILQEILNAAKGLPFVHEVRRAGLIGAIELRDEGGEPFPYHYRVGGAVCRDMRDFRPVGLLTRPLADAVVVMPPLAISEENMRYLCRGVLQSLGRTGEIVARIRQDSTSTERPS
jgi:adenosylmethionine---8-amino-7-oxononanoate aminotransferase